MCTCMHTHAQHFVKINTVSSLYQLILLLVDSLEESKETAGMTYGKLKSNCRQRFPTLKTNQTKHVPHTLGGDGRTLGSNWTESNGTPIQKRPFTFAQAVLQKNKVWSRALQVATGISMALFYALCGELLSSLQVQGYLLGVLLHSMRSTS